jgi:hypothetical protein
MADQTFLIPNVHRVNQHNGSFRSDAGVGCDRLDCYRHAFGAVVRDQERKSRGRELQKVHADSRLVDSLQNAQSRGLDLSLEVCDVDLGETVANLDAADAAPFFELCFLGL